ncbi:MAG: hypothetical protein J6L83_04305 [Clostridia bacterium]|nr:hypothetical protein [Clostridia bacterium]
MDKIINENIVIKESGTVLMGVTVNGSITVKADDVTVIGCEINGTVRSFGKNFIARKNKINCEGIALSLESGSYNCLVAQNDVKGEISVTGAYNCSVVLNRAGGLIGSDSENLYIIENTVLGHLSVTDNSHLVCDGNKFASITNTDNTLSNGDSLCDVDARPEHGADEDLLPHTNKDLFMGMERRLTVTDPTLNERLDLSAYIMHFAASDGVVIVPPGVYVTSRLLEITEAHSNTVVYAYGVYFEAPDYIKCLQIKGVENFTLRGLTIGYQKPSAGQMQILDFLGDDKYLCIASAGFMPKFGQLDPDVCTGGGYFFHPREMVSWTEIGYWGGYSVIPNEKGENINEDGTFVIKVVNNDPSYDFISKLERGEVLTCRLKAPISDRTASIADSVNVLLIDTVTYGFSGGLCFVIGGLSRKVKFHRHHNLAHSAYEIDEETYNKYKALEEKYGVDLEISVDELGRYRGAMPRIGSVDATHVTGSSQGLDAISTLFENSCDDATNQNGNSSCLHRVTDNGDGTSTLILKDNIPWVYYWLYQRRGREDLQPGHNTRTFVNGDRIFAYASSGRVLCDTTVISDAEVIEDKHLLLETDYDYNGESKHMRWYSRIMAVKVKTADLDLSAIDGIDPEKADYTMDNKVIVDNISRNSANFVFDNCMVRHNRGRFVIKTHFGTIKNCTFKDTSYAGIVMSCECTWGESSVPRHVTVENCLFDGASRTENKEKDTKYAAIAVEGLGGKDIKVKVNEDTLPARDITVRNNIFRNIRNNYYVTFSAVQDVRITGNVFETRMTDTEEKLGGAILVDGCMNVEISDNEYSSFASGDAAKVICANNYKNLFGSDVESVIPRDNCSE